MTSIYGVKRDCSIMKPFVLFAFVFFSVAMICQFPARGETVVDLGTATLTIDEQGYALIGDTSAMALSEAGVEPVVGIVVDGQQINPESVQVSDGRMTAVFPGGGLCEFTVLPGDGFALFDLVRVEFSQAPERLRLFSLALSPGAEILDTLNAGHAGNLMVAIPAAEPNVHPCTRVLGRREADRAGCFHELTVSPDAKVGTGAAVFTATSNDESGGWSVSTRGLAHALNLGGLKAIRAWVNGDGKGELLKIQLADGSGGCRDTYIPITFQGWQQVTVSEAPYNTLNPEYVAGLNIYYNGLPAGQTVRCGMDHIEAILERNGAEEGVLLEDFEPESSYWQVQSTALAVETLARYGLQPARFGVIACPQEDFMTVMERFEAAAGLPSPKPGGVWNKISPWVKRSYLFITSFKESQFEPVLALAKRGGFDMILMGQESWAKATGHYEINTENFPGGLDSLAATLKRFRQEGFHAGLHFLGPSIYPPDPYLTPVPDPRLVRDASAVLAADIDATTNLLPTETVPADFPAEDGGYLGDGTVVQIDDELLAYGGRSLEPPFGLLQCSRGILGTAAAPHAKGQAVRHLKRSYGYFLFDMDTTLLDEVSSNFARVANACDIDMVYFDGSERLQGEHWYYNARLHKAFFDKLARKDILLQASSYSHYSWHILARSASADGHGDLKGYLDERSPAFDAFKRIGLPLDIGWYYGYDTSCTPDMYEYILGATIGYDSSMSFQVSLDAASRHPFTGEILDLIARYERLRLSGKVPEEMRARLRVAPELSGVSDPEKRAQLRGARQEYRLLEQEGQAAFQRVIYEPWQEITSAGEQHWEFTVPQGPALAGVQIHVQPGPWLAAGPSYHGPEAVLLESFDTLAPYVKTGDGGGEVLDLPNGASGSTLEGVSQRITISETDVREGGRCAVYTAESALDAASGWSVFGKQFAPPLDLSAHRAIGFWFRGDGKGGQFKLQLLDGTKAADFYVANDYAGWRYHQLVRPEADPIDYSQVRTLNFYYNGLPAHTAVSCAIDDVKALAGVDAQTLTDPWLEIDGKRLAWTGTLQAGQYLFLWPGEPSRCYGPAFVEPTSGEASLPVIALPEGTHTATFGHAGNLAASLRVRVTLQPPERYDIPL